MAETAKKKVSSKAGKPGFVQIEFIKSSKAGFEKGDKKWMRTEKANKLVDGNWAKILK